MDYGIITVLKISPLPKQSLETLPLSMIFRIIDAEELNNVTNPNKAYLKLIELEKILKK